MRPGYTPLQPQTITSVRPIIPFDTLVDTEFGLLRLIKHRYCNSTMFYTQVFLNSNNTILYMLYTRTKKNPLQILAREKELGMDIYDNYYKEFMENKYKEILSYSIFTDIYPLVQNMARSQSAVVPTIVCKNNEEKQYLLNEDKELFEKIDIVISQDIEAVVNSVSDINTVFIKDIPSLNTNMKEGIALYIAGYRHNFVNIEKQWVFDPAIYELLSSKYIIKCYMPYPLNLDEYGDDEEEEIDE